MEDNLRERNGTKGEGKTTLNRIDSDNTTVRPRNATKTGPKKENGDPGKENKRRGEGEEQEGSEPKKQPEKEKRKVRKGGEGQEEQRKPKKDAEKEKRKERKGRGEGQEEQRKPKKDAEQEKRKERRDIDDNQRGIIREGGENGWKSDMRRTGGLGREPGRVGGGTRDRGRGGDAATRGGRGRPEEPQEQRPGHRTRPQHQANIEADFRFSIGDIVEATSREPTFAWGGNATVQGVKLLLNLYAANHTIVFPCDALGPAGYYSVRFVAPDLATESARLIVSSLWFKVGNRMLEGLSAW